MTPGRWPWSAVLALAAVHAAWALPVVVRGSGGKAGWVLLVVPPVLWGAGMLRRSAVTLLGVLPVVWAGLAYVDDPARFSTATGLTAVGTLVAYVIVTSRALAGRRAPSAEETPVRAWQTAAGGEGRDARSTPPGEVEAALAALLVLGPPIGFLASPGLEGTLRQSFGGLAGLVAAGLAVLGTLLGLAFATDLHRLRPVRSGSRRRVLVWAVAAAATGGGAVALALGAG